MKTHLDYPFTIAGSGASARTTDEGHIRDLIEQILFTIPGERVNRPDFGSGVLQLVFAPNSPELAGAVEFTLQSALQQWLADLIAVQQVEVLAQESTIQVAVTYSVLPNGESVVATVQRRTSS
jgi:phage baseplate assembly protein W